MHKPSLGFIAFLQALGIILYCGLVGMFFIHVAPRIGPQPGFLGPTVFLSLFSVSAVTCALIFLAYPFVLFWERKQTQTALRLVIYSTLWLAALVILGLTLLILF